MPEETVLSSGTAREAITRLSTLINSGMVDQISQLDAQGQILSDPAVWDGVLAAEFRSNWPDTKAALDRVVTELEELRSRVDQINANIMSAGGNR
ncbi:WXG100 family type VII secretion target [soil metagenome]